MELKKVETTSLISSVMDCVMFWGREQDLAECVLISSSIVDNNSFTSYGNHTDSLRYMLKSIKGFILLNL